MRTLKISLIATLIATVASFWAGELGLMRRMWPEHPQLAGFFFTLAICIAVQLLWPKEWLGGRRAKD
jgi:hypothetical protein